MEKMENNDDKCNDLFRFKCEFYEDLLELLIDIIDTELLESVSLKYLKAIDVEDANVDFLVLLLHGTIGCLKISW